MCVTWTQTRRTVSILCSTKSGLEYIVYCYFICVLGQINANEQVDNESSDSQTRIRDCNESANLKLKTQEGNY